MTTSRDIFRRYGVTPPDIQEMLDHSGVKGMKWGVRRKPNTSNYSTDSKKALKYQTIAKKKSTKALTNKELQHLITRMNLEQQYANLTTTEKKRNSKIEKLKKGTSFVKTILDTGKTVNDLIAFRNSDLGKRMQDLHLGKKTVNELNKTSTAKRLGTTFAKIRYHKELKNSKK